MNVQNVGLYFEINLLIILFILSIIDIPYIGQTATYQEIMMRHPPHV